MPWGDGKVDANDLEAFMSYWGQDLPDPNLVAHWRLDETEGAVAKDSTRARLSPRSPPLLPGYVSCSFSPQKSACDEGDLQ
jgi:hypothetical protein